MAVCLDAAEGHCRSRFESLRQKIESDMESLAGQKEQLYALLEQVEDPQYQAILSLRHFCGLTWEEVAEKTNYSARHVQRLYKKALEALPF
jgi:RNA polymerase sigma factor (sigma-70 family)